MTLNLYLQHILYPDCLMPGKITYSRLFSCYPPTPKKPDFPVVLNFPVVPKAIIIKADLKSYTSQVSLRPLSLSGSKALELVLGTSVSLTLHLIQPQNHYFQLQHISVMWPLLTVFMALPYSTQPPSLTGLLQYSRDWSSFCFWPTSVYSTWQPEWSVTL